MKIKYSYFLLRFPKEIALICHQVQEKFNATYIDLPFLLPLESVICEYRETNIITYENKKYFVANKKMDICFKSREYLKERYFGLINITRSVPEYIFWATFYDDNIRSMITDFKGSNYIRIYTNPMRVSATLKCGDVDV